MSEHTDTITVKQFTAKTTIGIHDWEQKQRQPVVLDLSLQVDCRPAAASDDIADALDYYALVEHLSHWLYAARFDLIEALAEATCDEIFKNFPKVRHIDIQLDKPEAVSRAVVGVGLSRSRP